MNSMKAGMDNPQIDELSPRARLVVSPAYCYFIYIFALVNNHG